MIQPRHTGGYTPQNQTALDVATLFVSDEKQPQRIVQQIKLSTIQPDPLQPRANMVGIKDLADSIRLQGQNQPIQVRRAIGARAPIEFTLIFGERRWHASRLAGNEYIDAIVIEVEGDTPQAIAEKTLEIQVSENIQREDFSLADICRSIVRFKDEFKRTHKFIAENHFAPLSKGNEDWVGDRYRAWKRADLKTRELMEKHSDVFSHVQAIVPVVDEKLRAALVAATNDGATVADLKSMIAQAEQQSNHVATEPRQASDEPKPYPTKAKVDAIVSGTIPPQPSTTQEDFDNQDWFDEKPEYSAQSISNSLAGVHSALASIERQIPIATESREFTEAAREALATQLKRAEDKARELRAVLSRTI